MESKRKEGLKEKLMSEREKMQEEIKEKSGEVEDVRQEEVDGKAGDEDSFEKERRGLSLGRLTIHASAVTFVRHSIHSLAKTHMCRHTCQH